MPELVKNEEDARKEEASWKAQFLHEKGIQRSLPLVISLFKAYFGSVSIFATVASQSFPGCRIHRYQLCCQRRLGEAAAHEETSIGTYFTK